MPRVSIRMDTGPYAKNVDLAVRKLTEREGAAAAQYMADQMELNLTTGGGGASLSGAGAGRTVRRGQGHPHVASRRTLNSIRVESFGTGPSRAWEVSVGGAALWLNYGRRPGRRPPLDPIIQWMRERGMGSNRRMAFAIQRKIGRNGMAATMFFSDAVVATRRKLQRREI